MNLPTPGRIVVFESRDDGPLPALVVANSGEGVSQPTVNLWVFPNSDGDNPWFEPAVPFQDSALTPDDRRVAHWPERGP